ncbi:metal-dependent hydrolase [Halorarum halophilum]|uniref:Metal-dependent hydrolase n=1 Tax=Halorarum halophilum TaxID=2743090 RepID=A0A7D5GKC5_9EURY|nr:metal-dependent hydrolase [Halobaculum halophilum]QLG27384.1 metal-dependent hydrolase [Halobaculum halophilum]
MPDILTHVLVGYCLATLLSLRDDRITPPYVTVAMLGTLLPDLTKIELLVPSMVVEQAIGLPFSWFAIHTPFGSLLAASVGALLVAPHHRRQVLALLLLGAFSHHALDAMLLNVTGSSYPLLWPLSTYHIPSPGLYLSSDRWPALLTGSLAAVMWTVKRAQNE